MRETRQLWSQYAGLLDPREICPAWNGLSNPKPKTPPEGETDDRGVAEKTHKHVSQPTDTKAE
jgi:hypothetical protein